MKIETLRVENFKGFEREEWTLHPHFNLVVGSNGSGKTSFLDAVSVAAGSWLLGLRGQDSRHIRDDDVRLKAHPTNAGHNWEAQYPCAVEAKGTVQGTTMTWRREKNSPNGRTTYVEARDIKQLAETADQQIREGRPVLLPLISYYGTGRLWNAPSEQATVVDAPEERSSRLSGYRNSVDPRLSVTSLVRWIAHQAWLAFQQGTTTAAYNVVIEALVRNVQGAERVSFDAGLGSVVVEFKGGHRQPFNNLSDGQRCMLAVVGDIAQKAARLNPHLNEKILSETPGVVLIDELDLHLHPIWQRHVIEQLRETFPSLQFVCTTHSPFLIQSLRSGEELLMLEGQPTATLGNLSIHSIAQGIQGVPEVAVGEGYARMVETAERALMRPDDTAVFEEVSRYADNPAFEAFLRMQRRAAGVR